MNDRQKKSLVNRIESGLRSIFMPFSKENDSFEMRSRLKAAVDDYLEKLKKECAIGDYCVYVVPVTVSEINEVWMDIAVEPPESKGNPEFMYIPSRLIFGRGQCLTN